jgi:hypothetical protein
MPGHKLGCVVRLPVWSLEVEPARHALAVLRAHGWDRVRFLEGSGDGVLIRLEGSPAELLSVLQRLPWPAPERDRLLRRLRAELAPPATPT